MLEVLSQGWLARGPEIFGQTFDTDLILPGVTTVADIKAKAERAQPKPTADNPLYANFGKQKIGVNHPYSFPFPRTPLPCLQHFANFARNHGPFYIPLS